MKTIVHLGYPKCASKSLQTYFAEVNGYWYVGKRRASAYEPPALRAYFRETLVHAPRAAFDPADAAATGRAIAETARANGRSGLILSDELLSSIGFASYGRRENDIFVIADRLRDVFGSEIRCLLVIREQASLLKSYYRQLVKQGSALGFQAFVDGQITALARGDERRGILGHLAYDRIVAGLIGRGVALHVTCVEYLASGADAFAETCAALDLPAGVLGSENTARASDFYAARLAENRAAAGAPTGKASSDVATTFAEEQAAALRSLFAPSNARLLELGLLSEAAAETYRSIAGV